jgi:hypothetical protein
MTITRGQMKKQTQTSKKKKPRGMKSGGLWENIHAKRKRIKAGSGEKMRKAGSKGAPTAANFARAKQTARS